MSESPLHYLHLHELAGQIRQRTLSPVDVTEHLLRRIAALDDQLKAFVTVMDESARAEAQRAEREIAAGRYRGPLHGIPLALKDILATQGIPTCGGSWVFKHHVSDADCSVVRKLRAAGAVILGKLNLTEGAMVGYNPRFDAPFNPWDRSMATGASSSGSGVATAAGLCFGAIGTDTGGSIRFPAAQCGIVGLKPTWGRVSRAGVMNLAQSLDHVGPMARCVHDTIIMLAAVSGRDEADPTTLPGAPLDLDDVRDRGVAGMKVGWAEDFATAGVDPEVVEASRRALRILADAGAEIIEVTLPDMQPYIDAWAVLCQIEAAAAHVATYPARAGDYGPWFRSWLARGTAHSAQDYVDANLLRLKCNGIVRDVFSRIDVLISPATLHPLARLNDIDLFEQPAPDSIGDRQRFTVLYDFNGAPTFTLPAGLNRNGFPLAIQIAGKPGEEDLITRAAACYEQATGYDRLHPEIG